MKEVSVLYFCFSGYPLDLKVMTTDLQNLETLRELWELLAVCRATVQEWECLPFTEVTGLTHLFTHVLRSTSRSHP